VRHDRRVLLLALAAGAPAVAVAVWLSGRVGWGDRARWTLVGAVIFVWLVTSLVAQFQVVRPLQTLANVLAALREGDFSFRARAARPDDADERELARAREHEQRQRAGLRDGQAGRDRHGARALGGDADFADADATGSGRVPIRRRCVP